MVVLRLPNNKPETVLALTDAILRGLDALLPGQIFRIEGRR
jgi:hypothetical protein